MNFNTLYCDLACPFCKQKILSGVGFQLGIIANLKYKQGEKLKWDGGQTRPVVRPACGNFKTIGYFNCDNITCSSWQDCYPSVQEALITVANDIIVAVEVYEGETIPDKFAIIEPLEKNRGPASK